MVGHPTSQQKCQACAIDWWNLWHPAVRGAGSLHQKVELSMVNEHNEERLFEGFKQPTRTNAEDYAWMLWVHKPYGHS